MNRTLFFIKKLRREVILALVGLVMLIVPLRKECVAKDEDTKINSKKPNILFIMTDQHNRSALGAYGNNVIKTPNMDKLAMQGMRFNSYYVSGFPCTPSRACYITGLYPHISGVVANEMCLPLNVPTMGNLFKEGGYNTAWIGKWHLLGPGTVSRDTNGKIKPDKRTFYTPPRTVGFDYYVEGMKDYRDYLKEMGLTDIATKKIKMSGGSREIGSHFLPLENGHSIVPDEFFTTTYYADKAIEYIKEHSNDNKPFFLAVSIEGPHRPFPPPEPWDKLYKPEDIKLPINFNDDLKNKPKSHINYWFNMRADLGANNGARRKMLKKMDGFVEGELWNLLDRVDVWTDREYKDLIAHYYGFVSSIDMQIGRVLQTLDDMGLNENTIVVYTTDHGDLTGSHGMIDKGFFMYDELWRVPLIVRYPNIIKPNTVSNALVENVDMLPTLLDAVGLPTPQNINGKSFLSVLSGKNKEHRNAVFCNMTSIREGGTNIRMLRTQDWKYCLNAIPNDIDELYDVKNDQGELNNLAVNSKYKPVCLELREQLFNLMKEYNDPWFNDFKTIYKE